MLKLSTILNSDNDSADNKYAYVVKSVILYIAKGTPKLTTNRPYNYLSVGYESNDQ